MKCLRTTAIPDGVEEVQNFVITNVLLLGADPEQDFYIRLMLEELFINICNYAYPEKGEGSVKVCVGKTQDAPEMLHIIVQDYGRPFNPLQMAEPDVTADVEVRPIGGLGIHFVRKLAKKMEYERKEESNILHLYMSL